MDVGSHNERMAALLIDQLVAQGVKRFCLAPGSRSTPLALAVAHHPLAKPHVHYDERGVSFYALGLSKAERAPAAIIVTSGTAVGNVLAAVMESSNDHVPLIVITADRPQALRDCSANQTCDQVKLFANFVRFQTDLSFSDPGLSSSYLATIIAQAVYLSTNLRPGPVHLNCAFCEPLITMNAFEGAPCVPARVCERHENVLPQHTIEGWAARSLGKKGIILCGALPHDAQTDALFSLAEKLNWPIYADILSQMRTQEHPHLISYLDPMLQAGHPLHVDAVMHFGGRLVSKTIAEWLKKQTLSFYLHVFDYPTLIDPYHIVSHRLHACSSLFAKQLCEKIDEPSNPPPLELWQTGNKKVHDELSTIFSQQTTLSEPGLAHLIGQSTSDDTALFLANSMPIRDAKDFFPPTGRRIAFFGNRGVSGIDGNIATIAGIAEGIQRPLIALLGDLAFLHDMNSLALFAHSPSPICLIIINNAGCGIFSFLPIHKKTMSQRHTEDPGDCNGQTRLATASKSDIFETFFGMPHAYRFSAAAELFDIPYAAPLRMTELEYLLVDFFKTKRSLMIEVVTDRTENLRLHEKIADRIRNALREEASVICNALNI